MQSDLFFCGRWLAAPALLLLLATIPVRAQEDIPAYTTLTCEAKCPLSVDAQPIAKPSPVYPGRYRGDGETYVEALVDISYTIGTDGRVKNPVVEQLIGPQEFSDSALAAIAQWQFKPATEDGKPVEQNKRARFRFRMIGPQGARPHVVSAYRDAIALSRSGKTADAIAALQGILARPNLNFYERTMAAYALAILYLQTSDDAAALGQIRDAMIDEGGYLGQDVQENAIRLRIKLEAANGELADSFAWFEILKKHSTVAADDPVAQLMQKLHALIDGPTPLTLDGRAPPAKGNAFWQHTLLRRTFGFAQIQGKLDKFELRCERHGIESPISDKAEWTVPASWSGCVIYVAGSQDSRFQFVELQPAAK